LRGYANRIKITATSVLAPVLSVIGLDAVTTVVTDAEGNHAK
jgi:hypothetical protein